MENNSYENSYSSPSGMDNYNQNLNQAPVNSNLEEPVSMKEWALSILILMVPCVNIVMMFVWAFSTTEKKSKSNFFKAYLMMLGIILALYFILIIIISVITVSLNMY